MGVHGKFLVVTATAGVSNTITVGLSPDDTAVVVADAWTTGKGAHAATHSLSQSFPLSEGFGIVKITGSNKADTITVDQSNGSFFIPTAIYAGGGNDTVTGGDENDAIWGQGGNDLLLGGGGNDALYGMSGRDTLIGGAGADYLSGGTGKDSLEGDGGNDTLYDPFGPDTVIGGFANEPDTIPGDTDNNTFNVHALRKDVNDYNDVKDTLHIIPVPGTSTDNGTSVTDIIGEILPWL
jgi:Ca2+-binding RTX toxin-like protein